jgi:hypothetical protein
MGSDTLLFLLASLQAEAADIRPRPQKGLAPDLAIVHQGIDIALSLLSLPTVGGDLLNKVWRVLRRESCSEKLPHSAPISLSTAVVFAARTGGCVRSFNG